MHWALSEEHSQLKDSVDRFVAEQGAKRDLHDTAVLRTLWREVADLGWLGAGLSEAEGGLGGGSIATLLIMEAIGRALLPVPFLAVAVHAVRLLLEAGHMGTVAAIVEGGKWVTAALDTNPRENSTTLLTAGEGFTLSGLKRLVPFGACADSFLVTAMWGQTRAVVKVTASAPGVVVKGYNSVDGHGVADVQFTRVSLATTDLLASGADADSALRSAEQHAIAALCAEAVGIAQFLHESTLDYVKARSQFGQPIGRFQALQHRMVDMFVAVEESRSLAMMAAASLAVPRSAERDHTIAAAKLGVLQRALHVARESIQLHGGIGMTEDLPLGAGLRRLKVLNAIYGGEGVQLDRMASGVVSGLYTGSFSPNPFNEPHA
jgi:alkylation response protein AidB-like acyl-CoA dehydrogenase